MFHYHPKASSPLSLSNFLLHNKGKKKTSRLAIQKRRTQKINTKQAFIKRQLHIERLTQTTMIELSYTIYKRKERQYKKHKYRNMDFLEQH